MLWIRKITDRFAENGRRFKAPVGWLLGRQLISGLKFIAVYSLFGPKLDPKDWMSAEPITRHQDEAEQGEFWFDYIADTGDGQKAVFNVAYLCLGDLWIRSGPDDRRVELLETQGSQRLPRGGFLFVGGDTAYHIADYETLSERFRDPFNWAFESRTANHGTAPERRPIYAIPANHDYYDAIDGFNRQFRKPVKSLEADDSEQGPQLELDGFFREQNASYVALKLPFDWWFWGLDSQEGEIDFRQREFFRSLCDAASGRDENTGRVIYTPPGKLIVATPEPSTAYRRWKDPGDALPKTFQSLGLDCAFLKDPDGRLHPESFCRLDISGDIHHYARYWGLGRDEEPHARQRANYVSVVAGGGGAFLHPTHTHAGQIQENRLYPEISQSVSLFVSRLLNPWNIARGGYIWAVGGLLALLLYFAGTIPDSTWSLVPLVPDSARPSAQQSQSGEASILAAIQQDLSVAELGPKAESVVSSTAFVPDLLIVLTLIAGFLFCALRCWQKRKDSFEMREWTLLKGMLCVAGVLSIALVWALVFGARESIPHPLLAALLAILFVVAGLSAVIVNRLYTNLVFKQVKASGTIEASPLPEAGAGDSDRSPASDDWISRLAVGNYLPSWILMISAFMSVLFGLWRYGIYKASVAFSDTVFVVILGLVIVGLLGYAVGIGAAGLDRGSRIMMFWIGLWHLILQTATAALLVARHDDLTIGTILLGVVLVTWGVGRLVPVLMEKSKFSEQAAIARILLLGWLVVGTTCLAVAVSGSEPYAVTGGRMAWAFAAGTIFGCTWFGWYLAVASTFRGHYNEAGGGARTDRYRHMIRFRLERERLTGYVIGIDQPVAEFDPQNPPVFELVDVFTVAVPKK